MFVKDQKKEINPVGPMIFDAILILGLRSNIKRYVLLFQGEYIKTALCNYVQSGIHPGKE